MSDYNDQLRAIVKQYKEEYGVNAIAARDVAAYAVNKGLWKPQHAMLVGRCAEDISRALREEYIIDPQGRKVRSQHMAIMSQNGEQLRLWANLQTATREHMAIAFQLRRRQIVGDCKQLNLDVNSYNENYNTGVYIQMGFDFRKDLEEEDYGAIA